MLILMQHNWIQSLCESRVDVPADLHGECSATRFEIYRASWQANLGHALADTYPVIRKLLGADFFQAMALRYIAQQPSRYGDIHLYGKNFADFLSQFEPVRELIYLPDVARLEWRVHQAFHAADAPVVKLSQLAALSEVQLAEHIIQLHPSLQLMQSDFPVQDIWQVNQDGFEQDTAINLENGNVNMLVFRQALDIVLLPLALTDYQFIQRLQKSKNITTACEQTLQVDSEFNMALVLHRLFEQQLVSTITPMSVNVNE